MPKQADNWGSRPVLGKDWGESVYCCKDAIDACNQIFANSWFTSGQYVFILINFAIFSQNTYCLLVKDFCDNEELSSEYHLSLNEDETSSLLPFYDSEMHKLTPILSQNQDDDDNSKVASINTDSVEDDGCNEVPKPKENGIAASSPLLNDNAAIPTTSQPTTTTSLEMPISKDLAPINFSPLPWANSTHATSVAATKEIVDLCSPESVESEENTASPNLTVLNAALKLAECERKKAEMEAKAKKGSTKKRADKERVPLSNMNGGELKRVKVEKEVKVKIEEEWTV